MASESRQARRPARQTADPEVGSHRRHSGNRPRAVRRRTGWWAAAIGIVLVAAALVAVAVNRGGPAGQAGEPRQPSGVVLHSRGGFEVGDKAPSFSVVTSADSTFSLPARKPAAVFFMAGWCGTCIPEAQALAAIDKEFGDRVAIVAVSADPTDSPAALRRFADAAGARYGFVHDNNGALTTAFGVRSLDTTVVVDSEGRIVFRDAGPTDQATLRRALSRAGLA
jgi:peroxiredoxin